MIWNMYKSYLHLAQKPINTTYIALCGALGLGLRLDRLDPRFSGALMGDSSSHKGGICGL